MKRFFITFLTVLIAAPLALGSLVGLSYYTASDTGVPRPAVKVLGQSLAPAGYTWFEPVFTGLLHRQFHKEMPAEVETIGTLEQPTLAVEFSQSARYNAQAAIEYKGEEVWSGGADRLGEYAFLNNGQYIVRLSCEQQQTEKKGHGTFNYQFAVDVSIQPRYEVRQEQVTQGDVLAIQLLNMAVGTVATAESPVGECFVVPAGSGQMTVYVPVSYDVWPGNYWVEIKAGRQSWTVPVNVVETRFSQQDLSDFAGGHKPEAVTAEALEEYELTIPPLFAEKGIDKYWEERFALPLEGFITADYGLVRADGRMAGMVVESDLGAGVVAPNDGKVVFAGFLANTGGTIVIDHGGGLKTMLAHLEEMYVAEGDVVQKEHVVGTVGETGDAMEPQLYYEVRMGTVPINPQLVSSGVSGLYTFAK